MASTTPTFLCRSTLSQISAVTVKNIVLIGYGMSVGFPTMLIADLSRRNVNDPLYLGPEGISWIGSINLITIPLGCLMSGVVTQPLGRRRSMQLINIPYFLSWIIFYFSSETWHILVTLAITGITGGLMEAPVLTYVAEISQPHLRGMLASTASVSVTGGIMTEFILGKFLDLKSAALCSLIVPLLSFTLLFLIPETPTWLVSKKKYDEAKKSLAWLRGWVSVDDVTKEYEELLFNLRTNSQSDEHNILKEKNEWYKIIEERPLVKLFRKRNFYRPFSLVTIVCFFAHFCGFSPVQVYAVNLFNSLHSPIDGHSATALLGIVGMIGSLICVLIIRKCGRRITSFISLSGTAISFFALGTYTHCYHINSLLLSNNSSSANINGTIHSSMETIESTSWYPFAALILASFFAQMGIRLLPWLLVGEVFPDEIRAFAAGMIGMIFYVIGFICNKTFLAYVSLLTLPGTFWTFSVISAVGVLALYFILPETEGKTLHEIIEHFSGKSELGNSIKKKKENRRDNEQLEKLTHYEVDMEKK